jgi:XTP/dITP diphosphohydrolase
VVRALDMAPGVYSARYAGEHGNDAANNALLLKNMEGERDRAAAFICALALAFPDGSAPIRATGAVEGEILFNPRGENGFGYDPLFWYDPMGKTLAEMTAEEKNTISHRGAAVRQLAVRLARRMGLIEDNN